MLCTVERAARSASLHRSGRIREALNIYDKLLPLQRGNASFLFLVGTANIQVGQSEKGIELLRRSLAINPGNPPAHNSVGLAFHLIKKLDEALASYDRALAIDPDFSPAHSNKGHVLRDLGRPNEALASYGRALAINPGDAEARDSRAIVLQDLKQWAQAMASCDKALALNPNDAEALFDRAHALHNLKRIEEAVNGYDAVLAIMPGNVHALFNRGIALVELKRFSEAVASFDKLLLVKPDYAEAFYNRGIGLGELRRPDEALASYDRALAIKPGYVEALINRGILQQELKRIADAIASFDRGIAINPGDAKNHFSKSLCKLLSGQFEEGWRLYEWRKKLPKHDAFRACPQPLWSGAEDIRGKILYVYAEQGLGDTIQFCRYAALAENEGAKVILCVQHALMKLISTLSPTISLHPLDVTPPNFDFHIPLLSLPLAFGTDHNNFPSAVPYLRADPGLVQSWASRIGGEGFKIGISWQGKKDPTIDRGRSFALRHFENLAKIPGVRLISLQKNEGAEQFFDLPRGMKIETMGDDFDEGSDAFIDTAAVMENMDLIITSDTAIAHSAGALGRPVWVALKYVPDWRWFLDRSDSPCYPTMRLFRQEVYDDWVGLFEHMQARLVKTVQAAS